MSLVVSQITPGDGRTFPRIGDRVTIEYIGSLENGQRIDSSVERGPMMFQIGVGSVLRCWDEGITRLSLGERAVIHASAEYCYGQKGFPPIIPRDAALRFDVKLIKIN